jgi:hypothetical protein
VVSSDPVPTVSYGRDFGLASLSKPLKHDLEGARHQRKCKDEAGGSDAGHDCVITDNLMSGE